MGRDGKPITVRGPHHSPQTGARTRGSGGRTTSRRHLRNYIVLYEINGAQIFSKLDIKKSFHLFMLEGGTLCGLTKRSLAENGRVRLRVVRSGKVDKFGPPSVILTA